MKEATRQFTTMEKFGLPIVLVLIVFGLYLKFGYDPITKENDQLKVSIANADKELLRLSNSNQDSRLKSAQRALDAATARNRRAAEDLKSMKGIIASSAEERSLMLERIGRIAEGKYKLKMRNFETTTTAPREKSGIAQEILGGMAHYKTVIIGDFFELNEFFKEISRVEGKVVLLDKVELSKSLTGDEKCRAVVEFSL